MEPTFQKQAATLQAMRNKGIVCLIPGLGRAMAKCRHLSYFMRYILKALFSRLTPSTIYETTHVVNRVPQRSRVCQVLHASVAIYTVRPELLRGQAR